MPVDAERAQHQDDAGATPLKANQEALLDTFPASDPVAQRGESGARAVPVGDLMREDEAAPTAPPDAATYLFGFPSREKGKLALEQVVRDLPLDRRSATLEGDEEAATLRIVARGREEDRIGEMMQRAGGERR